MYILLCKFDFSRILNLQKLQTSPQIYHLGLLNTNNSKLLRYINVSCHVAQMLSIYVASSISLIKSTAAPETFHNRLQNRAGITDPYAMIANTDENITKITFQTLPGQMFGFEPVRKRTLLDKVKKQPGITAKVWGRIKALDEASDKLSLVTEM